MSSALSLLRGKQKTNSLETQELEKILQESLDISAWLILLPLDGESGGLGFYFSLLLTSSLSF